MMRREKMAVTRRSMGSGGWGHLDGWEAGFDGGMEEVALGLGVEEGGVGGGGDVGEQVEVAGVEEDGE